MKLRYLLLFAAPVLLVSPIPTISAPVRQVAYESRTTGGSSNSIYQLVNPAVVTVFAGREIGSGSIVSPNGLVITNNHVVRGSSNQVFARTSTGKRYSGQVIATDQRYDLALIQLQTSESLPTVQFASGTGIQPGETVFAIGSPYGQPGVMTTGTFSSVRGNGDLQSRVVLQPGNSGGPLLNARGEMVGINKAILESSRGGNTGISIATSGTAVKGFIERTRPGGIASASPSPTYSQPTSRSPIPQYASPIYNTPTPYQTQTSRFPGGVVVVPQPGESFQRSPQFNVPAYQPPSYQSSTILPESRYPSQFSNQAPGDYSDTTQPPIASGASLGVTVDTRTLVIQQVKMGSAAANSGLQVGDQLVGVNGNPLRSFNELQSFMSQAPRAAAFVVSRGGRSQTVEIRF